MKKIAVVSMISLCLSGCAGVDMKPISQEQAVSAHQADSTANGYIVYEPVVVVEVSEKDVCVAKDDKGNCKAQETRCSAGTPFVLPDYSKPYLVNAKSGFGKAGVDITITDGWRLGNIKDNSDNTAVLGTVEKLLGSGIIPFHAFNMPEQNKKCNAPGLYRVTVDQAGVKLTRILVY